MKYGQFCPLAKALEVLGERWTLLVVRELISGATRYAELQRGLGRISPSVLSSRLETLIDHGIVEKVKTGGSFEYRLTLAGAELAPLIEGIGVWGQRWVRSRMTRDELDVELLMLSVQRNLDAGAMPNDHAVIGFVFNDVHGPQRRWWILIDDLHTELCSQSPGRAEDVTLSSSRRTLAEFFMGDTSLAAALESGRLEVRGAPKLIRSLHRWLRPAAVAAIPPASSS